MLCWLAVIPVLSRALHRVPSFIPFASMIRRLAMEIWPSSFLIKEYDRLYKRAALRSFSPSFASGASCPKLNILSTSLSTGELCVFSENQFLVRKRDGSSLMIPAETASVALAVASSSAYPALFSPILLNAELLFAPLDRLPEDHYLSDGGLFDNLGVDELANVVASGGVFSRVVVCDAGAAMTIDLERQPWGFFKRAIRTTDVFMNRVADGALRGLRHDSRFVLLSIHDTFDSPEVSINAEMTIGGVRTDLDKFNAHEKNLIANHGFQVADRRMYQANDDAVVGAGSGDKGYWFPEADTRRGPLADSATIRWSRLFAVTDWCTWANAALSLVLLYIFLYFAYSLSGNLHAAYLEHQRTELLALCDRIGSHRELRNVRSFADEVKEFWEIDRPVGLGMIGTTLRLHKLTPINNHLSRAIQGAAPFESLRGRITADGMYEVLASGGRYLAIGSTRPDMSNYGTKLICG